MKKASLFILTLLTLGFYLFASSANWELYTKDYRYKVKLRGTVWHSTIDGKKIIFNKDGGFGEFEGGMMFEYKAPTFYNEGMVSSPSKPIYYELIMNGKVFNKIRLIIFKGKYFLIDKRGIKYFLR